MILSEFKKFINSIPDEYNDGEVTSYYDGELLDVAVIKEGWGEQYICLKSKRYGETEGNFITEQEYEENTARIQKIREQTIKENRKKLVKYNKDLTKEKKMLQDKISKNSTKFIKLS